MTHDLATCNATQIAREELGLPITNTTMLGALLKGPGGGSRRRPDRSPGKALWAHCHEKHRRF